MKQAMKFSPSHDRQRDFSSFEPYTDLPPVAPGLLDKWLTAVKVQPISATEWDWSESWMVGPRTISDSMWFWFKSGSGWGWVKNESNKFKIEAGNLMVIPPGVPHAVGQDDGVHSYVIAVHFFASVFQGINLLELLGFPFHVPCTTDVPFEYVSHRLAREYAIKAPGWNALMAVEILELLLFVVRHHGKLFRPPVSQNKHAGLPHLLPVLELIEQNLENNELTVGQMAKKIHLSEVQFRKIFRRVVGISPIQIAQRQRIERACILLQTTHDSIAIIAEKCGFTHIAFFVRVFKNWTKLPPGGYRKAKYI